MNEVNKTTSQILQKHPPPPFSSSPPFPLALTFALVSAIFLVLPKHNISLNINFRLDIITESTSDATNASLVSSLGNNL